MELDRSRLAVPLALLALLSPAPVRAQAVWNETFELLGWNKQCSVAIGHFGFPKIGQAIADEPLMTRMGTLTIPAQEQESAAQWLLELDGRGSWDAPAATAARASLKKAGYTRAGFIETVRDAPVAPERDLPRLLMTTDTFKAAGEGFPPPPPWKLARVHYAPFSSACALFLYHKGPAYQRFYKTFLLRIGNPTIRFDRADAHVTNALLLFEKGRLTEAIEEAQIAAALAPERSLPRYTYGELLALDGELDLALVELAAAIKINPDNKRKARKDKDWDALKRDRRFKELTRN